MKRIKPCTTLILQKTAGLAIFFLINFLLHLMWENAQAPLYVSFESFWQHFGACLFATATGDMLFTFTIYVAVAFANRDFWWIFSQDAYKNPATWVLSIIIGVLLAVSFELWAVYVDFRWVYGTMPIIPIIKVGFTPVLQMIFLPLISFIISRKILAK